MKFPKVPGIAAAAALLIALSGCSLSSGDDGSSDNASSSSNAEKSDGSGGESKAGVDKVDPDDVVASQKVKVPGSKNDTVTVGIHSLTVEGKAQKLELVVTPHFESVSDSEKISLFDMWGEHSFGPQLVDMDHLKVYSVIKDSGKWWTSSSLYSETTNGKPIAVWAMFAAPEDDIDTVSVRLQDSWPEFTNVPVSS